MKVLVSSVKIELLLTT